MSSDREFIPAGRHPGGRPRGTKLELRRGEIKALKLQLCKPPAGASAHEKYLADMALQRQTDVMLERVPEHRAAVVLAAANRIRDQICGPLAQQAQSPGVAVQVVIDPYGNPERPVAAAATLEPEPKPVVARPPMVRRGGKTLPLPLESEPEENET